MARITHENYDPEIVAMPHAAGSSIVDVVDTSIVGIELGDILVFNTSTYVVEPANILAYSAEATSQLAIAANFAGFAGERVGRDTPAGNISVLRNGKFRAPCASDRYLPGELLAAVKATGAQMERSKLTKTTDPLKAIAVVEEYSGASATSVVCRPVLIKRYANLYDAYTATVTVSAENTGTDTVTITIQLRNAANTANVSGIYPLLHFLFSDSAAWAACTTGPNGAVTVATGTLIQTITIKKEYIVMPDSTGKVVITAVDTSGTRNLYALLTGTPSGGKIAGDQTASWTES